MKKDYSGEREDAIRLSESLLFSFVYDGEPSRSFIDSWTRSTSPALPGDGVERRTETFRDTATGLEVEAEIVTYLDFPAVEWVLHFSNTGDRDTPIIEDIRALDLVLFGQPGDRNVLRYSRGSSCRPDDFEPLRKDLAAGSPVHLAPEGGRSSCGVLPFFNLCLDGDRHGVIIAVGWSGQWAADIETSNDGDIAIRSGLESTHLRLHRGERIRTPRILALFWEGDRLRAHNRFRRLLLEHHRPAVNGRPCPAPLSNMNWGGTDAGVHLDNIRKMVSRDLPFDHYWIDAAWFGQPWYEHVGSWKVSSELYPEGIRSVADAVHASGRRFLLWFEPERVKRGSDWDRHHQDLLLTCSSDQKNSLLDIGDPAARGFLTDFISGCIDEFGIDCYRQDFNIDPLKYWREADAPDRRGITESKYIEGLYLFWDELLRRHPHLMIDNCSSGGRRIDLETIGRSIPLWRTDYAAYDREKDDKETAAQCHTYGLAFWVPLNASGGFVKFSDYSFRSWMSSGMGFRMHGVGDNPQDPIPDNFPFEMLARQLRQYRSIREYFEGDFHPLTEYSLSEEGWMAYQFERPDLGGGIVVALRRKLSPYMKASFPFHVEGPDKAYRFTCFDTGKVTSAPGARLIEDGFEVELEERPGSAVFVYEYGS